MGADGATSPLLLEQGRAAHPCLLQRGPEVFCPEAVVGVDVARVVLFMLSQPPHVTIRDVVILPQALRSILPPLAGQFISLIKDSSLLGIIAIRELTKATREVVTSSLQPFELWFVCALLYLVLTFSLSMLLQYVERRTLYQ